MKAHLVAALADIVGLAGIVAVIAGVDLNWGRGWALIVGGAPFAALYFWSELRSSRPRRRG